MVKKDGSSSALQERNLVSKFLYRTLQKSLDDQSAGDDLKNTEVKCLSLTSLPQLPEPQLENIPHLGSASSADAFVRNYLWTFEDIRMLIGSNMPIFGDADHPCVSLRLRDMKKPINILTGKHLSLIGWQITILHNL